MARLIEESYIADLKKWAEGRFEESENGMGYALLEVAVDLENMPSVVRCKDCKHWLKDVAGCTDFVGRCEWANYMVGAVGYCVYGERKDNG